MPQSYLDQLQEVSRRQGKPYVDPTRIEGFGDGAPPAPPMPESPGDGKQVHVPTAAEMFGGEPIEPKDEPEPVTRPPLAHTPSTVPEQDLVIVDRDARFRGQTIQLNEIEHGLLCRIVVRALKRGVDEQYAELKKLFPERRRKTVEAKPAPKKRGRPKKSES